MDKTQIFTFCCGQSAQTTQPLTVRMKHGFMLLLLLQLRYSRTDLEGVHAGAAAQTGVSQPLFVEQQQRALDSCIRTGTTGSNHQHSSTWCCRLYDNVSIPPRPSLRKGTDKLQTCQRCVGVIGGHVALDVAVQLCQHGASFVALRHSVGRGSAGFTGAVEGEALPQSRPPLRALQEVVAQVVHCELLTGTKIPKGVHSLQGSVEIDESSVKTRQWIRFMYACGEGRVGLSWRDCGMPLKLVTSMQTVIRQSMMCVDAAQS